MLNRTKFIYALSFLLAGTNALNSAVFEWGGTNSSTQTTDLLLDSNWQDQSIGQTPHTAIFTGSGNLFPQLAQGETFQLDLLSFSGNTGYQFDVNGSLIFSANTAGVHGVKNLGGATQTFKVFDEGEISFQGNANAAFDSLGDIHTVNYEVGDTDLQSIGTMLFEGFSSAGGSKIDLFSESSLSFDEFSTAGESIINQNGDPKSHTAPVLNFNDRSDAGMATISIYGSDAAFSDEAFGSDATINLIGTSLNPKVGISSVLDFFKSSSAGNAVINAVDGSFITFFDDTTADRSTINLGTGVSTSTPKALMDFLDKSSAGSATINIKGGYTKGNFIHQSSVVFDDHSTAENATINLGDAATGFGGKLSFFRDSHASQANITAGQSSTILFSASSSADTSQITLNDQASLTFKNSSASAKSSINLNGADTNLYLKHGSIIDEFTGVLSGNGSVNKVGDGGFSFKGDASNFTGTTKISQGVFFVDSPLGGIVEVLNGGTIAGSSTILSDVTLRSGGSINPHTSILTINGDLIHEAGSMYKVLVNPSATSSLVQVNGKAIIAPDSTVNIVTSGYASQLPLNQSHESTLLTANGGISGTFLALTTSNPLIVGSLIYSGNSIQAVFVNKLSLIPETFNQRQVANQLQLITFPTPAQDAFLNAVASLSDPAAQQVLDQLSGEEYTNLRISAELSDQQFLQRLYDPLRRIITANTACCDPCQTSCCDKGWELWFDGDYKRIFVDGNRNAKGFNSRGYDFTLGAQASVNKEIYFGTALAYEKNIYHYNLDASRGKNYSVQAGFYGLYRPCSYYVLSDFIIGCSKYDIKRFVSLPNQGFAIHGHPKVIHGEYYCEIGKDYDWNCILFQPFLGLEAGYFHRRHIKEHSASQMLDLTIKEKSQGFAFSRLGLHMTSPSYYGVVLYLDLGWRFRFTAFDNDLRARFQGFGTEFTIKGIDIGRNSLDGTINLTGELIDGWDFFIEASGQWWQRTASYNVLGGLQVDW